MGIFAPALTSAPDPFVFFQVSSKYAGQAYDFHQSISSTNEHIWPRTEEQISEFAERGELFGVRRLSTGEFAGLCYSTLEGVEWEIGGLTVTEKNRHLHLGTMLVRFALAHTIATSRPWHYQQQIIAHVHEDNQNPRNLLRRIGFEFLEKVTIPGDQAPASMKRDENGNLSGDKFRFPQAGVAQLSAWFDNEFAGMLADGKTPAEFEIPPGGLETLKEALREAVADLRVQE